MLAGGEGRRLSGGPRTQEPGLAATTAASKPATLLAGRPLLDYPVAVLAKVCARVAVVCKRDTWLPELVSAEVWIEPDAPRHPLTGLVHALKRAKAPVLVCAGDMPFLTVDACRELVGTAERSGLLSGGEDLPGGSEPRRNGVRPHAILAATGDGLEPLCGVYAPSALESLCAAAPDAPLREAAEALDPVCVELPRRLVRSVNTPEDLTSAEAELATPGALA